MGSSALDNIQRLSRFFLTIVAPKRKERNLLVIKMIRCWANTYIGLFANVHYIAMRKCIIFMVPWLVIQLYNVIETLWLCPRRLYKVQDNLV